MFPNRAEVVGSWLLHNSTFGYFLSFGFGIAEQPFPHMIDYGLQPVIADSLAVHTAHIVAGVAHDMVDRGKIASLVGHGSEHVPQRIEP